jgi:signal peptidase
MGIRLRLSSHLPLPRGTGSNETMSLTRIAKWVSAVIAVILIGIAGVALVLGWRTHYLLTPSMGDALPVGSLVVTSPVNTDELVLGDIVTADIGHGRTRTHRVVDFSGEGIITQGDLNAAPDVVPVSQKALIGKVVFSAYGVGWLMRLIPYVVGGGLLMWLLTLRTDDPVVASRYRSLGVFLGLSLGIILVKPLFGVALLGTENGGTGNDAFAEAHVVSTGLLPVRVDGMGEGGTSTEVLKVSGQDGFAEAHEPSDGGGYMFRPLPAITWPWWIVFTLVVASPWLWYYTQHRLILRREKNTSQLDNAETADEPIPEESMQ